MHQLFPFVSRFCTICHLIEINTTRPPPKRNGSNWFHILYYLYHVQYYMKKRATNRGDVVVDVRQHESTPTWLPTDEPVLAAAGFLVIFLLIWGPVGRCPKQVNLSCASSFVHRQAPKPAAPVSFLYPNPHPNSSTPPVTWHPL